MAMIANIVVALVAALHLYFLVLEMFLWTRPLGLKTFRNSPEKAADSAVLAANQGLYNGFLAAGLVDHMHLVQVPIVLGRGVRVWDGLESLQEDYEIEAVSAPSGVTHITFDRKAS